MGVLAIVPARGGSKGIPGKNIVPVGGVPLVARAVASAIATPSIDRVIVSTDDDAIAACASSAGAEVMQRAADISGDTASSESALLDVLDRLDAAGEPLPEVLVFIQATSPFIDPHDLSYGISMVASGTADVAFSAVETFAFLWAEGSTGAVAVNHNAEKRPRRQDRAPHFRETGAFYVMRTAGFRTAGFRFFGRIGMVQVRELTSLEIDGPDELALAAAVSWIVSDTEQTSPPLSSPAASLAQPSPPASPSPPTPHHPQHRQKELLWPL
jgi:CMP-N-acetylneuraminic acid synthetase